jgi:hypothetical protein
VSNAQQVAGGRRTAAPRGLSGATEAPRRAQATRTAREAIGGATEGRDARAWAVVQTPGQRGRYQHEVAYKRRESKRAAFRQRLRRTGEGCWLWDGPTVIGAGHHPYPIFYHRRETTPDNTTRAAFHWMMREWFPEAAAPAYARTGSECGNSLCLSPYHRYLDPDALAKTRPRMGHRQVLDIYSWRGTQSAKATAELFGVHPSTVENIWNGKRWSAVTGHHRDGRTPPMDATRARAIYADRNSGMSMADAAAKHGTSRTTLRSIWYGLSWAEATGAKLVTPEPRRLSDETRRVILRRRGKQSAHSLAKELGVGKTTVLTIWSKAGLSGQQGV